METAVCMIIVKSMTLNYGENVWRLNNGESMILKLWWEIDP